MKVTLEGTFHILSHISDVDGRPLPYFIFPALYHVFLRWKGKPQGVTLGFD